MPRGDFSGWAKYKIRLVSAEYKRWLFIKNEAVTETMFYSFQLLLRMCSNPRLSGPTSIPEKIVLKGWIGLNSGSHSGVEVHSQEHAVSRKKSRKSG